MQELKNAQIYNGDCLEVLKHLRGGGKGYCN